MVQAESNRVLIAVELGADWPSWLSQQMAALPRLVLSQSDGESCDSFAVRVLASARRWHKKGGLATAVVICNERTDTVQQSSRRLLLLALPKSLRGKNRRLTLAASADASERLQTALRALVRQIEGGANAPPLALANGVSAKVA